MPTTEESFYESNRQKLIDSLKQKLAEAQEHQEKFTEDQLDQLAMDCRAFKLI